MSDSHSKDQEEQKRRFLCAIGKADDVVDDEIHVRERLPKDSSNRLLHWTDKIATDKVKEILEGHQNFDIKVYLDNAMVIYLAYSRNLKQPAMVYDAFTYVLTHARSFGDSTQSIFQLERSSSKSDGNAFASSRTEFRSNGRIGENYLLTYSMYLRKISALIKDLQISYDEMKFRVLNTNVTYITLLILRRFSKDEKQFLDSLKSAKTHEDYEKLCPHPLHSHLPIINQDFNKYLSDRQQLRAPVLLAIHAFLTENDAKTKRVLRATCVQYVEWNGLQMPGLFFKVVSLYGMEEAELWEWLGLEGYFESLFKMADVYYRQYKKSKTDPTEKVAWFPYCRALHGDYHRNLSASDNLDVCMILAYLLDLKMGFNKSFARNSHWAKNFSRKDNCLEVAKKISGIYLI